MMGALTPVSSWTPEDDLRLKNAIEAGASLESLAKGAIQFSRRFTIRELQERWYSLLYDPDISAEASALMMEFEHSTSNLTSKSSKLESSKEGNGTRKRKVESVRRRYYALKKKICSDPLNHGDLNFLVAPAEHFYQNGNEAAVHNGILGDPMNSHFELGNSNFDALHTVFLQDVGTNIDGASHESNNGDGVKLENQPKEQQKTCEQISHVIDQNNVPSVGNCTVVGGLNSSTEMPVQSILADDVEMHPMSNDNNMYSGLEGNNVFNSPISESEASFQHLQCSSPPSAMPGDAFVVPDDPTERPSEYGITHSDIESPNQITCDGMKTSASCPQFDLIALSDTLLNLSDDDAMLLIDDDGKEIDKYGLCNLLLDSPADLNDDQMLSVDDVDPSVAPETDLHVPSTDSTEQLDEGSTDMDAGKEKNPACASDTDPQLPELCHGLICCTLNTEVLEVPDNSHVIFPSKSRLASFGRRGINEVSNPALTVKDISLKQANETGLSLLSREMKRFGELHADPQARHGTSLNRAVGESIANLKLPRTEKISTDSRNPGNATCNTRVSREVISETVSRNQSFSDLSDLPAKVSDGLNDHLKSRGLGIKQEGQAVPAVKKLEVHMELGTTNEMAPEPVEEPLLSDMEELLSDSDDDIPYCSDIESMILDMDLGPEDPESYSSREVAKYQSEDAKRAIIRLEQSAHAYMQRAIASHCAFAVIYGRHSKHYIKKPEVLLGRATEDSVVDIDLGKEGRANKISRRQAIIKMDENGVFHLRNLGKSSILVDDKEVYTGQSLILQSKCLIEIRDIPFIFENNQARVKQYLDDVSRRMPPK